MRALVLVASAAALHFAASLVLGVLAFMAQGDLTNPGPPSLFFTLVSTVVTVLEFPIVTALRTADPERLRGFMAAAVTNSMLWGVIVVFGWLLIRRTRGGRDAVRRRA
jgi:hypothetical protein